MNGMIITGKGGNGVVEKCDIEEFAFGAKLVVQDNFTAVFCKDGKVMDMLPRGEYEISPKSLPLLDTIYKLSESGAGSVQAQLYFVNKTGTTKVTLADEAVQCSNGKTADLGFSATVKGAKARKLLMALTPLFQSAGGADFDTRLNYVLAGIALKEILSNKAALDSAAAGDETAVKQLSDSVKKSFTDIGLLCDSAEVSVRESAPEPKQEQPKEEAAPAADTPSPKKTVEPWDCACGQKGIVTVFCTNCGKSKPEPKPEPKAAADKNTWDCACGQKDISTKFCPNCGKQRPEPISAAASGAWDCACGQKGNTSRFCINCGKPRPADTGAWDCSCGQKGNTSRFCINCGAPRRSASAV